MKFSDEQLSETLAVFGCTQNAAASENRAQTRVPMGTRATIIPCGETGRGEVTTVVLLNLSDSGIGILNGAPMRSGEHFILSIPATSRRCGSAVLCSVVHVQNIAPSMYAIGAQFSRVLAVKQDQSGACSITDIPDAAEQDLAHVREVENRLNRLSF